MDHAFPADAARPLIELALLEDFGDRGDLSSTLVFEGSARSKARWIAKADGVLAGLPVVPLVFEALHMPVVKVEFLKHDGDRVAKGDLIATFEGPTIALLGAERTMLNFVQQLSGVATVTARYVAETRGTNCRILDTRKTLPGWRELQKYAVRCGGGKNHRMGLFDMIMLKDNHIAACGGVSQAIERVLATRPEGIPVEVEVESLEQLEEALKHPVERIMLDNMPLETMAEAVKTVRARGHRAELEASGNMTLERIAPVAATGVDFISVGALTHSVKALDVSMRFE